VRSSSRSPAPPPNPAAHRVMFGLRRGRACACEELERSHQPGKSVRLPQLRRTRKTGSPVFGIAAKGAVCWDPQATRHARHGGEVFVDGVCGVGGGVGGVVDVPAERARQAIR